MDFRSFNRYLLVLASISTFFSFLNGKIEQTGLSPHYGDIYWVRFNPTEGNETYKKRPAVVISREELNGMNSTVIVAPLTSQIKHVYPFEVIVSVNGKPGKILLNQMRAIDRGRIVGKKIAVLGTTTMQKVVQALKFVLSV